MKKFSAAYKRALADHPSQKWKIVGVAHRVSEAVRTGMFSLEDSEKRGIEALASLGLLAGENLPEPQKARQGHENIYR